MDNDFGDVGTIIEAEGQRNTHVEEPRLDGIRIRQMGQLEAREAGEMHYEVTWWNFNICKLRISNRGSNANSAQ